MKNTIVTLMGVLLISFTGLTVSAEDGHPQIAPVGGTVADGGGMPAYPIVSVIYPGSPMRPVPQSVKVEIFVNARAVKTVSTYRNAQNPDVNYVLVGTFTQDEMHGINKCLKEAEKYSFKPKRNPGCMDDPGVSYKISHENKTFAFRQCGQFQVAGNLKCAKKIAQTLDQLSVIENDIQE